MRAVAAGVAMLVSLAGGAAKAATKDARLQFERGRTAWVMNADGSGQHRSPFPGYASWSPDGRRVAYVAPGKVRSALFLRDADGRNRRRVLYQANVDACVWADWSPRGAHLVVTVGCDIDFRRLYLVRRDATGLRRLVPRDWVLGAAWSPDGRSILFAGSPPPHRGFDLYLLTAQGRKPRRIPGLSFEFQYADDWTWGRDGRSIFVLVDTNDGNRGLELSVIGRGGGKVRQLTPLDVNVGSFDLSPDGKFIVFQGSTGTRDWEIYVIRSDGSGLSQLTDNHAFDTEPQWSPNGERIAFTSDRDGNDEIYVMNADGSNQVNLTRNSAGDTNPSWIPSG